jgi:hypothetical protein
MHIIIFFSSQAHSLGGGGGVGPCINILLHDDSTFYNQIFTRTQREYIYLRTYLPTSKYPPIYKGVCVFVNNYCVRYSV